MLRRRRVLLSMMLLACGGAECRLDPSPSCSYRPERGVEGDGGAEGFGDELAGLDAGDVHACALVSTGDDVFGGEVARVRCWGGNPHDQLARVASPEPGELWWYDDWDDLGLLAVGAAHACYLDPDARIDTDGDGENDADGPELGCWGNAEGGQIGVDASEDIEGLVYTGHVPILSGLITSFAAGGLHTCVADTSLVSCMGDDRWDQLGRIEEADCCDLDATAGGDWLIAEPYDRIDIDAGTRHSCALLGDVDGDEGRLHCWGDDTFEQLGPRGRSGARGFFFLVAEGVRAFATGPHHSCAVDGAGDVRCWGRNDRGELGSGDTTTRAELATVALPEPATQVFAGGESGLDFGGDLDVVTPGAAHSCALTAEGRAWCWGDNSAGQLGLPAGGPELSPVATHPGERFRSLALGGRFTCGITLDERLLCWGDNAVGQLGREGESSHEPTPIPIFRESGATP